MADFSVLGFQFQFQEDIGGFGLTSRIVRGSLDL